MGWKMMIGGFSEGLSSWCIFTPVWCHPLIQLFDVENVSITSHHEWTECQNARRTLVFVCFKFWVNVNHWAEWIDGEARWYWHCWVETTSVVGIFLRLRICGKAWGPLKYFYYFWILILSWFSKLISTIAVAGFGRTFKVVLAQLIWSWFQNWIWLWDSLG